MQTLDLIVLRTLYAEALGPGGILLLGLASFLGSGWLLLGLAPAFFVRSLRALRTTAATVLVMLGGTATVVSALKAITGRLRPCHAVAGIHALERVAPVDPSFPSGHATGSFAFAAFVFALRPGLGGVAFLLAGLVAMSRVALGVHYPSDVLAGALLGTLIGLLVGRREKRRNYRGTSFASASRVVAAASSGTSPTQTPKPDGSC